MSTQLSPLPTGTLPPVLDFQTSTVELIQNISRLAAEELATEAFVEAATRKIEAAETTSEVALTLRNPVTGEVWQTSAQGKRRGTSEFSLELEARGVRYGRFELRTTGPSAAALTLAQTLADQFARYAELQAERTRNEHLSAFGRSAERELRIRKVVARACGIVASSRGLSEFQANTWLMGEARRQRRPLVAIAEQVIKQSSQPRYLEATA